MTFRELVKQNGYWSIRQFCLKSGISESNMSHMLKNNRAPSLPTLVKMHDNLDVEWDDLIKIFIKDE